MAVQVQPMTMLYMSPEDFTMYLYKAMEKGKELERARSLDEDYITTKEAMEMLNISSNTTFYRLVRNREFTKTKAGVKKSEVLDYIERTKKF
ncbi:MAG: helix-turn-helix domain-containing protein [Bacteroidales bacterium]|nr:helix-turn-helix domain-containing protein [Bacteroidales bacterium]